MAVSAAVQTFRSTETIAVLAAAVVGGCIPILQPLLLGGLLAAHHLNAAQLGQTATLESLGMAVSVTVVTALARPVHLRLIAAVAALILVLANLATPFGSPAAILVVRILNGLASGVFVWVMVGLVTRAAAPGRLFATYFTATAAASFVLSVLFTSLISPNYGVVGSYIVLAILGACLLPVCLLVPNQYQPLPHASHGRLPNLPGTMGLLATGCHLAGVSALWVYLVPLGRQMAVGQSTINIAVSAAIGAQILGGIAAIVAIPKVRADVIVPLVALVSGTAVIMLIMLGANTTVFFAGAVIISFLWMFTPPFQLPFLLHLDASHRSASFVSTAQLFGISAGPLAASLVIGGAKDVAGAAIVSAVLFGLAATFAGASRLAAKA